MSPHTVRCTPAFAKFFPLRSTDPPPRVQVGPRSYTKIPPYSSSSDNLVNTWARLPRPPGFLPEAHSCPGGRGLGLFFASLFLKGFIILAPPLWMVTRPASFFRWNPVPECGIPGPHPGSLLLAPCLPGELTEPGLQTLPAPSLAGPRHIPSEGWGTGEPQALVTSTQHWCPQPHRAEMSQREPPSPPVCQTPSACSHVGGAIPSPQRLWRLL